MSTSCRSIVSSSPSGSMVFIREIPRNLSEMQHRGAPFFRSDAIARKQGAEACTNSGRGFGTEGESRSAAMIDSLENPSPLANMLESHLPELDHILGVKEETGVIRALPRKQD